MSDRLTRLIRMTARNEDQRRSRYLTKPSRLIPVGGRFEAIDGRDLKPGSEPIATGYGITPGVVTDVGGVPMSILNFQTTAWWTDADNNEMGAVIGGKRPERTAALDPFSNFNPED
ncbi:hypothetical protein [Devosia sp. MC521]|uniref:hypothetical protein n=1 Tax=Devosia sp. MC521 TaxID=2759954 RepID=UPI0015F7D0A7|nr:hypothetical protein [Devosia sp. MC521]MBJ6986056.1 hypothetical protein [Devosia sp. MC521]QMW61426.1 hypothetical protein H4N61_10570 [Devosia sp. MC521]